ncbi:MAG TPA: adhesin, partial [Bacteroidia bacterium]|nr:adhesin [Bacteroidia bacterium]
TVTITQPLPLRDSLSFSSPLCSGGCNGIATANVSGGTVGYKYLWNTGATTVTISGLCTGSYTVTVTDTNNCTTTDSVTIVQPPLLKDTISSRANVSCNGGSDGSATVTASGGKTPYTYSWTTGSTVATATNLSAGN